MDALTVAECSLLSAVLRRRSLRAAALAAGLSRASALRLIRRLEAKNGTRLVADESGGPGLTAHGRVLLRASLDLHGWLETNAEMTDEGHHSVRIASSLECDLDIDPLARLDPPLVIDVTATDGAHAVELFDGGYADALALWELPDGVRPARDAVRVPLFEEDLWVVGQDVPATATRVADLPDDLVWVTTACQVDLFESVLGLAADSARVRVVESRQAHRILILSGRATGLVTASHCPGYDGLGLTRVRPEGASRRAVLYTDRRCDVRGRLPEVQAMFRDRSRRMFRPPVLDASPTPPARAHVRSLGLDDVTALRAIDRHGSLNRAASELCLTQPALTRRLRKLEDRVGTHLVVRTATGSTLTAEASAMLERVDAALARFHANVSAALPTVTLGRPGPGARGRPGQGSRGVVGVRPDIALRQVAAVHGPGVRA